MNNGVAIGAVALSGVGAYLLFAGKASAKKSIAKPAPVPTNDAEFGEAPFPPPEAGAQWDRLRSLAAVAEQQSGYARLW